MHRRAIADAWADDRSLAAEPAWLQMAAPAWHAALPGSASIASWLLRAIDPLTSASTAGDLRALAAIVSAVSAGVLFVVLRRAGVRTLIALPLCGVTVAWLLPVGAAASASHALLMLLGTAIILTVSRLGGMEAWGPSEPSRLRAIASRRRVAVLAVVTILGGVTHAAFLAFAAGIWVAEWRQAETGRRARAAIIGIIALSGGLALSSWLLVQHRPVPFHTSIAWPDTTAMVVGLVTGQFDGPMQPSRALDLLSAIGASVPAPAILSVPLAALAFLRRDTRALALGCALAATFLVAFLWETWVTDPRIAGAPARIAVTVLVGLGLSWVAAQPGRGALALAAVASALIGLRGFVEPTHWSVPATAAQMQAFVETAPATLAGAVWSVDRLAVARAILAAHPGLESSRVPVGPEPLAALPADRAMITIGSADRQRMGGRLWTAPFDVPYPSAERFLGAQPDRVWMTVAVTGGASEGFCGELLARLGSPPRGAAAGSSTLLAHLGRRSRRASLAGTDRLRIPYGHELPGAPEPVPARIAADAGETTRIEVNARTVARVDRGMAIAALDPWTGDTESWLVGPCDHPTLPSIRDERLAAAYVLRVADYSERPRTPVLAVAPLRVPLDADDWFGRGWHGAEGRGDDAFRWTGARAANVNVAVARPQPIRVRMSATLATAPGVSNALGLSWNGTIVCPIGPWTDGADSVCEIPVSLVVRGVNVLTVHVAELVTPSAFGGSDTRALGAVVDSLSFEPGLP